MNKKKTAFMLAAVMSLTVLSSCGTSTPAATTTAPETTQATGQTTTTAAAASEATTSEATTASEAPASETTAAQTEEHSDRVDIPESEWDGYMDKIFAANQREAVFANHRSLAMSLDLNIDAGEYKADYNWFTKDYTYYRAPAYEELSLPEVRYELVGIGTEYAPVATYYLDMIEGGYQFWYTPAEKSKWYDPEHETIGEMYIQDEKLYYNSVYDEAGSENYFNVLLPQGEYTGGIVRYTSVLDANTFEPIGASIYYEKDGKNEEIITEHYEYDIEPPRTVDVLAGVFERYNPNVVTVTATAHPGTDKEITTSVTVPANSTVSFYTPDMTAPEYFKDYECTQPYTEEWDMMSDLTVYIRDGGKQE